MATIGTLYFYAPSNNSLGLFSQHADSKFTVPVGKCSKDTTPLMFYTAEQYMMWRKAQIFEDEDSMETLAGDEGRDPQTAKYLGRAVKGFDEDVWKKHREAVVEQGNYLKFSQNPELKELLLSTADHELVEAAARDRIWGIGFKEKDAEKNRKRWGLNLLGKALMRVRTRLREEEGTAQTMERDK